MKITSLWMRAFPRREKAQPSPAAAFGSRRARRLDSLWMGLLALALLWGWPSESARADGGGLPTNTPPPTQTSTAGPTTISTATPASSPSAPLPPTMTGTVTPATDIQAKNNSDQLNGHTTDDLLVQTQTAGTATATANAGAKQAAARPPSLIQMVVGVSAIAVVLLGMLLMLLRKKP